MKIRRVLNIRGGNVRIVLEALEGDPRFHDYGIPRSAWLRAVKFIEHFGVDHALEVIDERAFRAGDRRDFDTSRRWRELITAIHAMTEDERLFDENTH